MSAIARAVPLTSQVAEHRLGALPSIALVASTGLMTVALANTLARISVPGAWLLWWVGLIAIFLPAGSRLLGRSAGRGERLAIVVVVGMALYLVKLLHGPGAFVMFDEFLHWATLQDINETGRLFTPNNILATSPFYPGVEVITDVLMRAGIPVWEAGVLVVGAARLLHVLALFLIFDRVSGDARVAGLGTLLYMTNPSFLFFDAQFSYESVALPLATYAIWLVVRREPEPEAPVATAAHAVIPRWLPHLPASSILGLTLLALLAVGAVVVTHHVSAIALSGFLIGWAVISLVLRLRRRPGGAAVLGLALFTSFATVSWMLYVASVTVGYLAPAVSTAASQVLDLMGGEEGSRELFRSATGVAAPAWEQVLGYAAVLVALALLPVGLVVLWRRYRARSAALALGMVALVYPATLLARLTARGAELSARSAEFVFIGVGFVGALALVTLLDRYTERRVGRVRRAARPGPDAPLSLAPPLEPPGEPDRRTVRLARSLALGALLVLATGGAILGMPAWARLPGPYLVSADPRSVEPVGLAASAWTARWLARDQTFLSDRINRVLLAVYGRQHPITAAGDKIDVKDAYFAEQLLPWHVKRLAVVPVRYVIADRRLTSSLPYVGVYVERGEARARGPWRDPLPMAALDKWDTADGSDRIYDNGQIRIFDIGGMTGARP